MTLSLSLLPSACIHVAKIAQIDQGPKQDYPEVPSYKSGRAAVIPRRGRQSAARLRWAVFSSQEAVYAACRTGPQGLPSQHWSKMP